MLPAGWTEATIRDLVDHIETTDPTIRPEEPFQYVDIGSIDNRTLQITNPKTILGRDAPSRARRKIRKSDVLFSTVRPYLKNIAIVPPELDGAITSTGICVLRALPEIEPGFLFRRLASQDFVDSMTLASDGTMYPAIADGDIFARTVFMPPAAEQRRIVAKLAALTARLAHARAELDRLPILAKHLRHTSVTAAFQGWPRQRLGDLSDSIHYGYTASAKPDEPGSKFLRITDIQDRSVDWKKVPFTTISNKDLDRCSLRGGDIVFARSGATVGSRSSS